MVEKKLYRSEYNRIVAGVCAGLAEYLDMDPTIIRLIWVLFTLFVGSGVLVYILAVIIIPNENDVVKK